MKTDSSTLVAIIMLAFAGFFYWRASADLRSRETKWYGITFTRSRQPTEYWLTVGMHIFGGVLALAALVLTFVRAVMGLPNYM